MLILEIPALNIKDLVFNVEMVILDTESVNLRPELVASQVPVYFLQGYTLTFECSNDFHALVNDKAYGR